jgi:hypothetical protein
MIMKQVEERYISLLTDFGFKRIFGTAMNKDLLMNNNEKKWLSIKDTIIIYGIKRTSLYKLLALNQIESKLISPRRRIVSVLSIEEFIDSK